MKKILSILLSVSIVLVTFSYSLCNFSKICTPEIPFNSFLKEFSRIQEEYKDEPVSNRLIVKSKYDINELDSVGVVEGYNDLHILQFDNSKSASEALEYYKRNKLIEYVEEDALVTILDEPAVPDNQLFGYGNHLSWGSDFIGTDDYIDTLESVTDLPEIIVGIIDTGIELNHEFIKGRIIKTRFNMSDTGIENSENDDHGHGTHVAGIIVDNTTENVKIKAFKCLNSKGTGPLSAVALAVDLAVENDVNVINMSLGAKGESKTLEDSVNAAIDSGVTVCVAAGNSGSDCSKFVPANIEGCITVAAIGQNYSRPFWSNWGKGLDIIAPGVSINSSYLDNTYKELSGTSMAAPFVSASAALLLITDLSLNCEEISSCLEENGINNWSASNDSTYYRNRPLLYIGSIHRFEKERTKKPQISIESGYYSDEITVEITCEEEADIYYTLDGSRCTEENGIRYLEPIKINAVTNLHAISIAHNKIRSFQVVANYYITSTDPETNFTIDENGIITEYKGNNDYLNIPDRINGITVNGIGDNVFRGSSIVMIKLPDTLNSVGYRAFRNCDDLYSFECENLKFVAKDGFYSCERLTRINLSNLEEVGDYGFQDCSSISELNNDKLTVVNKYAFSHLTDAVSINLPNVKRIEMNGLDQNLMVSSINISNVEYLGRSAIRGMYLVQELEVPKLKEMSDLGSQFWSMSSLTEIDLSDYEGAIPQEAFAYCTMLSDINISNATEIKDRAFIGCNSLKSIDLGNSLSSVGVNAFKSCLSLTDVFYDGIENEWNSIQIEKGNDYLKSATIYYSLDNTVLLAVIAQAKACSKAEYTKDSLETLYDFADSFVELANRHAEQYEYDVAAAQILDAIGRLDSLSNYTITAFDGKDIILTNQEGKTTSLTFLDFVNEKCESLDVVEDGIVNAKDYAFLLKEYSKH